MNRIKSFTKYLVLFLLFFAFVDIMIYIATKIEYKEFNNFNILTSSPKIEITNSEKTNTKGNVKIKISNDTGMLITGGKLTLSFYQVDGTLIGNKYEYIRFLNINENMNVTIEYAFTDVDFIELAFEY